MSKKVIAVNNLHMGHKELRFEDGSKLILTREAAVQDMPKVGENWPPDAPTKE